MAHEVRRHDVVQKIELTAIHSLAKAASQRLVLLSSRTHSQPPFRPTRLMSVERSK